MGLQENIRDESIDQLEIRDPVNLPPTTSLRETIELMRKHDMGCAVVVDEEKKPVGAITESMLAEMLAHGTLQLDDPVSEHMSDRVPWVKISDPIADVVEAMQLKNIRILCVVDDQGRSIGLTGQRGLMEYVADHFPGEVMVQRVGQTPYLADREGA
jgi:CBS domain-containing protein